MKWDTRSDGYTIIPVCIAAGSSAKRTKPGEGIHDPNPSLEDVVGQVRDALRSNWEAYSSVRFVGWQNCDNLTQAQRNEAIGLYIHADIGNSSALGIAAKDDDARHDYEDGKTSTYYSQLTFGKMPCASHTTRHGRCRSTASRVRGSTPFTNSAMRSGSCTSGNTR